MNPVYALYRATSPLTVRGSICPSLTWRSAGGGTRGHDECGSQPRAHSASSQRLGGLWVVVKRAARTDQNKSRYVLAYTPIWRYLPYLYYPWTCKSPSKAWVLGFHGFVGSSLLYAFSSMDDHSWGPLKGLLQATFFFVGPFWLPQLPRLLLRGLLSKFCFCCPPVADRRSRHCAWHLEYCRRFRVSSLVQSVALALVFLVLRHSSRSDFEGRSR